MLKDQLLDELQKNRGVVFSGQSLADHYSVSRNAVWKTIHSLMEDGYPIQSAGKKGYFLPENADLLSETLIREALESHHNETLSSLYHIHVFRKLDSTNSESGRMIASGQKSHAVVLSDLQTNGKARGGEEFQSPAGSGLYFSMILPLEVPLSQIPYIPKGTAVAVCEAIHRVSGIHVSIHNNNDLYIEGRKLGGILSEGTSEDLTFANLDIAILGIGLRMTDEHLPDEIKAETASLNGACTRNALTAELIRTLHHTDFSNAESFIARYKELHDDSPYVI